MDDDKRSVYVVMGYFEWQEFKRTGQFRIDDELCNESVTQTFRDWIVSQVNGRMQGHTCPNNSLPVYCFSSRPKIGNHPPLRVVLKVRIEDRLCVDFNDDVYVRLLNSYAQGRHTYIPPHGTTDDSRSESVYPEEVCLASYSRMFDDLTRPMMDQVYIPYLTRSMVKKVWVYRNDRRLRRRRVVKKR
jgi:hypothetical protein